MEAPVFQGDVIVFCLLGYDDKVQLRQRELVTEIELIERQQLHTDLQQSNDTLKIYLKVLLSKSQSEPT